MEPIFRTPFDGLAVARRCFRQPITLDDNHIEGFLELPDSLHSMGAARRRVAQRCDVQTLEPGVLRRIW